VEQRWDGRPEIRSFALTGSDRKVRLMRRPRAGSRKACARETLASRPPALRPAARSSKERWAARGGDEGAAATAPDRGLEHGPRRFPEARPKGFSKRRMWSAGRRLSPIARRKETPSHGVSGGLAGRSGSDRKLPRLPALRSPHGERDEVAELRLTRGRSKNTGDGARLASKWNHRGALLLAPASVYNHA
jgi:hypothetical protein